MGRALKLGLHDARASAADREWLTNVYPFYLHDLSEFDEHYYTLNDRGLWEPDHRPSWLQDDIDHPLIIRQSETRVGFASVNQAPSADMMLGFRFRLAEFFILKRYRRTGIGLRAAPNELLEQPDEQGLITQHFLVCGGHHAHVEP